MCVINWVPDALFSLAYYVRFKVRPISYSAYKFAHYYNAYATEVLAVFRPGAAEQEKSKSSSHVSLEAPL